MQAQGIIFTYDDYLTLPNDGKRYEIIDGDLHMSPSPIPEHQLILWQLTNIFTPFIHENKWGKLLLAPTDVVFSMTDVAQPDLMLISRTRDHIITKKNSIAAPDFIVAILSEGTEKTDRTTKKTLYEKYGVTEYWIVNPFDRSIEVVVLEEVRYVQGIRFTTTDLVRSALLTGLSFPTDIVFEFE